MKRPDIDAGYLIHSAYIQALHSRYLQGIDAGEIEQVRSCFTEDVKATYHGRAPISGLDNVMGSNAVL